MAWEGQRKALNDSGISKRFELLEQMEKASWKVYPEVPVSAAPFRFDPVKCITKIANDEFLTGSLRFREAVAYSRNEFLRRETVVDALAVRSDRALCIAVEETDRNASLVFTGRSKTEKFSALSKIGCDEGEDDLMRVPKADNRAGGLSMRMEPCSPGISQNTYNDRFSPRAYEQCLSLTADAEGKYSPDNGSIAGASGRIVCGTFGLAVESLVRHVSSGKGCDRAFIPVIVTAADILACESNPSDSQEARLEPRDAVICDFPVPASARFPNQIADFEDHERMRRAVRWPVVVANREGLSRLLY